VEVPADTAARLKIVGLLQADFVLTLISIDTAARLNASRWTAVIKAKPGLKSYILLP